MALFLLYSSRYQKRFIQLCLSTYVCMNFFFLIRNAESSVKIKRTQKQPTHPVHNKIFPFRIIKFVLYMTGILYCSRLSKLICSSPVTRHFIVLAMTHLMHFTYTHSIHRHTHTHMLLVHNRNLILLVQTAC